MAHKYTIKSEGGKRYLFFDYRGSAFTPSIADVPQTMKEVIEVLKKNDADLIVLSDVYERIYDEEQTAILSEIADLNKTFQKEGVWNYSALGGDRAECQQFVQQRYNVVATIAQQQLSMDPIQAYINLVNVIKQEKSQAVNMPAQYKYCNDVYLNTLTFMLQSFEKTKIIQKFKFILKKLGKVPQGRDIYRTMFETQIKPSFISSRVFFSTPENIELIDQYNVMDATVNIYKHPEKIQYMYYIDPPEYNLSPEKYFLLTKTKELVANFHPEGLRFMSPNEVKDYFISAYESTIADLARRNNIRISGKEITALAKIVARYTVGYGMMELLLSDRRLTDVYMDAPLGLKPVYIVHSDYGSCQSNVVFTEAEAKSVISRFRSQSGRPFDEAHPVLDFDIPDLQTRVAVIGPPLSPDGTAFALRLHKETPWTLPQFIEAKMVDKLTAGMLSFFIDAQTSTLVNGSRGAGKCLTGDTKILLANGELKQIQNIVKDQLEINSIKNKDEEFSLVNSNNTEVITIDNNLKTKKSKITGFYKRKTKKLIKIKTATGKELSMTPEHPLFTLDNNKIVQVPANELVEGQFIPILRKFTPKTQTHKLNVINDMENEKIFVKTKNQKQWIKQIENKLHKQITSLGFTKRQRNWWLYFNGAMPIKAFIKLDKLVRNMEDKFVKAQNSKPLTKIPLVLDSDLAKFLSYVISEGHIHGNHVIFTNSDEKMLSEFKYITKKVFGLDCKQIDRDTSSALFVNSYALVKLLKNTFGVGREKSRKKRIPDAILSSSNDIVRAFLQAYFDAEAYIYVGDDRGSHIELASASSEIIEQVSSLLKRFEILSNTKKKMKRATNSAMEKREYYSLYISSDNLTRFKNEINFSMEHKRTTLESYNKKTNPNIDVIPDKLSIQQFVQKAGLGINLSSRVNVGRQSLQLMLQKAKQKGVSNKDLENIAFSDLFFDKITSIETQNKDTYVYDIEVPETHNFIANEIISHNSSLMMALMLEILPSLRIIVQEDTLEIPVPQMRKLGYNIQRLKTQSAISISRTSAEVSPEDALRTALRLGDSVLIVGEVRSQEAKVLYEAMRVGAVGNVVMGTIHGESAYSVWDRIVNDLGVKNTSFKATDIVVTAAPVRFQGSLRRHRRLVEITEVGKKWYNDPEKEGGLIDLVTFDTKKDKHILMTENLERSEMFPRIAKKRGMDIEQIWDDIHARAETKNYLVQRKKEFDIPDLLEGTYTVPANDKWLLTLEEQRETHGSVDYDEAVRDWKKWVDENPVKELLARKTPGA